MIISHSPQAGPDAAEDLARFMLGFNDIIIRIMFYYYPPLTLFVLRLLSLSSLLLLLLLLQMSVLPRTSLAAVRALSEDHFQAHNTNYTYYTQLRGILTANTLIFHLLHLLHSMLITRNTTVNTYDTFVSFHWNIILLLL